MKIVCEIGSLDLDRSRVIGLVPTMGAFHRGHLQLMKRAREECDTLVVSLFVNPTQFGEGEDFQSYPRNEERDFELAQKEGVDVVFAPTVEEMYPDQAPSTESRDLSLTKLHVSGITELWEGAFRPGHFDGVATVVAKLFNIVRPDFAVFGEKDYQQCRVIEQMVLDLNMPVKLIFEPTLREADGLALSSRNVYLDPEERRVAPELHAALRNLAQDLPFAGEVDAQDLLNDKVVALSDLGFKVDYLELVDSKTLQTKRDTRSGGRLIVAARLGKTRLIDNVALIV